MSLVTWLLTGLAGGAGAVLRLLVDERVRAAHPGRFPAGILVVNLTGALLAGLLSGAALTPATAFVVATGFVGAYSTFSTWMLDLVGAAESRLVALAAADLVLSLGLGLAAAAAGIAVGSAV